MYRINIFIDEVKYVNSTLMVAAVANFNKVVLRLVHCI